MLKVNTNDSHGSGIYASFFMVKPSLEETHSVYINSRGL